MPENEILTAADNSRSPEQQQQMEEAARTGKCPFCHINWNRNELVIEGKYWYLMKNLYPYPGSNPHLVLVCKSHVTTFTELTPEERLEWFELAQKGVEKFQIPGGGMVMRFGDLNMNAGTIAHLHGHIQVPDGSNFLIAVFYKNAALEAFLKNPGEMHGVWLAAQESQ